MARKEGMQSAPGAWLLLPALHVRLHAGRSLQTPHSPESANDVQFRGALTSGGHPTGVQQLRAYAMVNTPPALLQPLCQGP